MKRYDPLKAPDTEAWLALDEDERIRLIEEYHWRAKTDLPNQKLHSIVHVIVENQIAMGDELPVQRTVARLVSEGLDRHEAIHAVGSVLAKLLWQSGQKPRLDSLTANHKYLSEVEKLTAENWRQSAEEPGQ